MTSELSKVEAELSRCRKLLQHMIDQTTPLEPVPGDPMWSRRIQLDQVIAERDAALAELEALRYQVGTLTEWYSNALDVIAEVTAAIPGVTYMDLPDGGDVSIPEQIRRMAKDAERYSWLRVRLPGSAYRIAGVIYSEGGQGVDVAIDAAMLQGQSK